MNRLGRSMGWAWVCAGLWLGGWGMGCGKKSEPGERKDESRRETSEHRLKTPGAGEAIPWFRENAAAMGIGFRHSSGFRERRWMPQMLTGGVGWLDYDGDGRLDLFCVNGGSLEPGESSPAGHRLYRNLGNGRFEDVTVKAGVSGGTAYGMGCAVGDYDGDGWLDLYVTCVGRNLLYRNKGDGTFEDVTDRAGVGDGSWGTSAAWVDVDEDGWLDLVVVNYLRWSREVEVDCFSRGGRPDYCSPNNYNAPAMDTLYRNRGDGTFERWSEKAGLDRAYGNGLGVATADFNRDGHVDLYVANDAMPNQLWIGDGKGRFVDEALLRGCAVNAHGMPRAGMGVTAVDLLQRGWFDIYITHLVGEGNGVFLNTNGYFLDFVSPRGPAATSHPYTGFGVVFADFDHDGILDAYIGNGRVKYGQQEWDAANPYAEPNTVLRGLGGGEFVEMQPMGGTTPVLLAVSRGVAAGDFDEDGDVDLAISNKDGPVHVLENVAPKKGNWIRFDVRDKRGRHALNAVVEVRCGTSRLYRQVAPNDGYCSSHDPRAHFGVGAAQRVDAVFVRWPGSLAEEEFGPFETGQTLRVTEGQGRKVGGAKP